MFFLLKIDQNVTRGTCLREHHDFETCMGSGVHLLHTELPPNKDLKPIFNFLLEISFHKPKFSLSLSLSIMACSCLCSPKFLAILFLLTAIPIGIIISLERTQPSTHVYHYHSKGFFRECAKWDSDNHRFINSFFEGGIGQISVPEKESPEGTVLEEVTVLKETELAGNASLGMTIDQSRNRIFVVNADVKGSRYSALVAYDLSTWKRLFLTQLSGPSKFMFFFIFFIRLDIFL